MSIRRNDQEACEKHPRKSARDMTASYNSGRGSWKRVVSGTLREPELAGSGALPSVIARTKLVNAEIEPSSARLIRPDGPGLGYTIGEAIPWI